MKREFNWTQEFQKTRNGHKVRILCRDVKSEFPIVGICQLSDGTEMVMSWLANGCFFKDGATSVNDLRPLPPKKHVRWVNCYPDDTFYAYSSREEADNFAHPSRIACIRDEFTEGQFDE